MLCHDFRTIGYYPFSSDLISEGTCIMLSEGESAICFATFRGQFQGSANLTTMLSLRCKKAGAAGKSGLLESEGE